MIAILIVLGYVAIAVLFVLWLCPRLFQFSDDAFDCFEDHEQNMDDEGGWK